MSDPSRDAIDKMNMIAHNIDTHGHRDMGREAGGGMDVLQYYTQ